MKVPPLNLAPENMSRVNMPMHLSPEFIWRSYNQSFLSQSASAAPSSPIMMDIKSCNGLDIMKTIPSQLNLDPRTWSRDDVVTFLRWVEKEYDLPSIDNTKFYMNGKALMMLNKNDLTERAPAAGDILHNTLQQILGQSAHVPPSPLTPHHPILSPSPLTSSASNPSQPWGFMADFHNLSHLLQQNSSVTLSPAHSEQSGGSPRHPDNASTTSNGSAPGGYSHSGSQSDSEDSTRDSTSPQRSPIPPHQSNLSAQTIANIKHISNYQRAAAAAAAVSAVQQQSIKHEDSAAQHYKQQLQQAIQLQQQQNKATHQQQLHHQIPTTSHMSINHNTVSQIRSSPPLAPITSNNNTPQTPDEPVEPGTNGRLLWDFLQQLLNDREQRYNRYIAWRNAETGVFKIVDPPGLARLWGIQKNHLSMNYDKMSRALRYYYRVNILRKVQGERHCYQFLRNPSELRNIKNISSLKMHPAPARAAVNSANLQSVHNSSSHLQAQSMSHHQMQSTTLHPQPMHQQSAPEPIQEDEGPTDLSMATLNDNNHKFEEVYVKMEDDINVDYD